MKHTLCKISLLLPLLSTTACAHHTATTDDRQKTELSRPIHQADMLVRRMHEMLSAATHQLQQARELVHVRKIVCVGEAHEIIRSTVRIADRYHVDYLAGVSERDRIKADNALLKISLAHARVDVLHGQMMGCGGTLQ